MGRWLLDAAPMWVLGVVFVVGPGAVAGAVAELVRRRWRRGADGEYKETGGTLLTQTLAIYGIVLAFVIVNQYNDFNETRKDVQTEALNLEDVYRSASVLDAGARAAVSGAVGDYVQSVVRDEWATLGGGGGSPDTAEAFTNMYTVLYDNAPTDDAQLIAYSQALDYLHVAHDARHRRLDAASDTLPGTLSAFLLLGAAASVASTLLLGMRRHQLIIPISLAGLIGFTLLLSLTLDHPFSGDSAITSEHFTQGALGDFFRSG